MGTAMNDGKLELGYDESKTEMALTGAGNHFGGTHRRGSRARALGILLACQPDQTRDGENCRRPLADFTQISFVSSMRLICDTWIWCSIASAGAIPTRLNRMRELFTRLRSLPDGRTGAIPGP